MAKYFDAVGSAKWIDCPHRVDLPQAEGVDATDEIEAWMKDPARPGHWFWTMNRERSGPHFNNEDTYWSLRISDPDVAFEAKMRWG